MKQKISNSILKAFAIALACCTFASLAEAQTITWHGGTGCNMTLVVAPPNMQSGCNQSCGGVACNTCKTFKITNNSSCTITSLSIAATLHQDGTCPCFSICGLWGGGAATPGCDNTTNPKFFDQAITGGTGIPAGGSAYFSICYAGTGPEIFGIFEDCSKSGCDCCHSIGGPDTNIWTVSF